MTFDIPRNIILGMFTQRDPETRANHTFAGLLRRDQNGQVYLIRFDYTGAVIQSQPDVAVDSVLLIPIPANSALTLRDFFDTLREDGKGPYYFNLHLKPQSKFERRGMLPTDFNGSEKNLIPVFNSERDAEDIPYVVTNCINFIQNMIEHIGSIPLARIGFDSNEVQDTIGLRNKIKELSESNVGEEVRTDKLTALHVKCRLIKEADGVYFGVLHSPLKNALKLPKALESLKLSTGEDIFDLLEAQSAPLSNYHQRSVLKERDGFRKEK